MFRGALGLRVQVDSSSKLDGSVIQGAQDPGFGFKLLSLLQEELSAKLLHVTHSNLTVNPTP